MPISVVIPAYKRPAVVGRAVRTALAQQPRPPAEVIVVDDCSGDGTAEAAEAAGARVIRHERNLGVACARNTAVRAASQGWIALLDSDDEWLPSHLAELWNRRDGHVILGATAVTVGPATVGGRLLGRERDRDAQLNRPSDLLAGGNALVASSVLVRREAMLGAGLFREGMRHGEDMDLWLRVLERGTGIVAAAVTVRYHVHEGQASDASSEMRAAHRAILASYRDRPWCSRGLLARAEAILLWDEFREDLRNGQRSDARGAARRIATDPRKLAGVLELLRTRASLRRRSRRMGLNR